MQTLILNPKEDFKKWNPQDLSALILEQNNIQVGNQLIFRNDILKVWTIHLFKGESIPFHKHCKPYLWIALTKGRAISKYSDGYIVENVYEVNDFKCFTELNAGNFFIHNLENIGDTDLIFIVIEFV